MTTALLWFRRDLRLADHPAFTRAVRDFDVVVPVFVLDDALRRGRFASAPREEFMLGCLRELDAGLRERGSALVVREGRPADVLGELAGEVGAEAVLWTSDVSPYARARDSRVSEALRAQGVAPLPQGGGYVVDVSKPRTQAGTPFAVFTPFFEHWRALERRTVRRAPAQLAPLPSELRRKGRLPAAAAAPAAARAELAEPHCQPGEAAARGALTTWLDGPIDRYGDARDIVAEEHGTSGLSPYLRWGCVSAAECEARAAGRGGPGAEAWIRQLAWRDFYAHVLLAHPANARLEYQEKYRALEWEDDDEAFAAWCDGHRLSARRRGDAPARPDGLDAQPRAPGRRIVSHQGPAPRLAPG